MVLGGVWGHEERAGWEAGYGAAYAGGDDGCVACSREAMEEWEVQAGSQSKRALMAVDRVVIRCGWRVRIIDIVIIELEWDNYQA